MNIVELMYFLVCFVLPASLLGMFVGHRTEPRIGLFVGLGTLALLLIAFFIVGARRDRNLRNGRSADDKRKRSA
jgi:hypothetical protein